LYVFKTKVVVVWCIYGIHIFIVVNILLEFFYFVNVPSNDVPDPNLWTVAMVTISGDSGAYLV